MKKMFPNPSLEQLRKNKNTLAVYPVYMKNGGPFAEGNKLQPLQPFKGRFYKNGGPDIEDESGFAPDNNSIVSSLWKSPNIKLGQNLNSTGVNPKIVENDNIMDGFGKRITDIAPFASNITNSFRKLPNPPAPQYESSLTPNLVDFGSDRNNLKQALRSTDSSIDYHTSNPAIANANKVAALAQYINGNNDLSQQEKNINSQIKNQVGYINSMSNARNVERTNEFLQSVVGRNIAQQNLQQENLADLGNKIQQADLDKKLMDQEDRKLNLIPLLYKDTGVVNRNLLSELEQEHYNNNKKYGGSINIKKANRGKFSASAQRAGMSVQEFAGHVLGNKGKYSPTLIKRANFARNASKWHH